ncbi:unnamed protein product [Pleuronectes platessa]|uniref:Uncharacterized protein n=1 Tax=Pleuronectes platessa TaxID=8262 RepID=A0A9N7VJ14_PLEPL|nr:unnamed protein product [Pleuronectes platessa]
MKWLVQRDAPQINEAQFIGSLVIKRHRRAGNPSSAAGVSALKAEGGGSLVTPSTLSFLPHVNHITKAVFFLSPTLTVTYCCPNTSDLSSAAVYSSVPQTKSFTISIKYRINFKILLITYKTPQQPGTCLSDLLHQHSPTRRLRSTDAHLLQLDLILMVQAAPVSQFHYFSKKISIPSH